MDTEQDTDWMRTEAVAKRLDVPSKTLTDWRYRRIGPPFAKFGRHVRYRRADVDAWAEGQVMASAVRARLQAGPADTCSPEGRGPRGPVRRALWPP